MADSQLMYLPETINTFRVLCRSERRRREITQREMADDIEVAVSTVSMLENGHRLFSYEMAEKFNDYLNLEYILPKPDHENSKQKGKSTSPLIERHSFLIELDGDVIEVISYRKLGPIKKAKRA